MSELQIIAKRDQKTVYRDGDKAVKVFESSFTKANILNEALNQARAEETGLNIPEILEVTKVDGKWAIVSEFAHGKTLEQLMQEHPDKLEDYMNLFVDLQLEMHSKKAPLLNKLKDKMIRKITATGLDATVRYELNTRLQGMPTHTKVCHGDFNPSNIIIDDSGKAAIVDWAHATQGNASADTANTYLYFSLQNEEAAKLYMDLFCKKSDTAKQYVEQWLPLVAASRLTKGVEAEKEFLMKWIDVCEYQ